MAKVLAQVEKDGFVGSHMLNEDTGKEFISWQLGVFRSARGSFVVTGVSGVNGRPKAAAYNLQNGDLGFWTSRMRANYTVGKRTAAGTVIVSPNASVQVTGYEQPRQLVLEQCISDASALGFALELMTRTVVDVVATGVYAIYSKMEADEAPEGQADAGEELGELQIQF